MHSLAQSEIASQPTMWRQVASMGKDVAPLLPKKGERVGVVGCGTSWFMSQCYASLRETSGEGETDAATAAEFLYNRNYDRIVVICRSGTTTEVVELLEKITAPSVVITGVPGSPVTEIATESIILDFADEESVLQTRYATSALGLLRASLGTDLRKLADQAEIALASDLGELPNSEQITFLGQGWTVGLAHEGALKTREAAQFWAEAYPALDYRHGPISIAQQGRTVWSFGEIDQRLQADIRYTGALLETSTLDPMVHLIRAQRTAIALAEKKGFDPDNPRGLTRSIVLS
jgi:fructoselysine-6-P-deglycase FrlB-like protein